MKPNLPLSLKKKRLVHSRLVPVWDDAFDLRVYFACTDPGQYDLPDKSEYASAKQLFGVVQRFTVNWVALYRALVHAPPKHQNVLEPAIECFESFLRNDAAGHLAWYESSLKEFGGKSPGTWFRDRGLFELAAGLRFYSPVDPADALSDVPLQPKQGSPDSVVLFRQTPFEGERKLNQDQRSLLRLVRSLFSQDEWEDEFDLSPYFAAWSPVHQVQAKPADVRRMLEVYDVVIGQVASWIRVYRGGLEVACRRAGALEGVTRCALKAAAVGRTPYLEWYHTPQSDFFEGMSPKKWFLQEGLKELDDMLGLGSSRPEESA